MTGNARVDLFSLVHKGVRRLLFETAMELARTDFLAGDPTGSAARAVGLCFEFLREHAEHEDRVIQPWVARFSSTLAATLAAEHVALEKASIAVESLLPRLASAAPGERLAMGIELQRRFHRLVADQLHHLDREEREANAVLWANLPDASLTQLRARLRGQVAPARLAEWYELLAPVLTGPERDALAAAS